MKVYLETTSILRMSEKLFLQWNDFKENVNSAFGKLRDDKEFTDVTLVCEDGQQMEAHKVILASSSPFFEKIFQKGKHPHSLIYLRWFLSKDFASILDFLYFGEANVYQEDLDSFLAIADEIELKGLTGPTSTNVLEEQENSKHPEPSATNKESIKTSSTDKRGLTHSRNDGTNAIINPSAAVAIANESSTNLQALDEKVKSMMEKGQKMIPNGAKDKNGKPVQKTLYICKVCGKEGLPTYIRNHIESNHFDGISIPCDHCGKTLSSRASLGVHKSKYCVATRGSKNQSTK